MKTHDCKMLHARYSIRKAESRHIPLLNAIELAAARLFPEHSLPEHVFSETLPADTLLAAMQEGMLWVAVDADGAPVGYVLFTSSNGLLLLAQIDVHPLHGRKGIGTALIAHGIEQMQAFGFSEVYLTTFAHVQWNAPFYEKLGFELLNSTESPTAILSILRQEHECGLLDRVAMRMKISEHRIRQLKRACKGRFAAG